MKMDCGCVSDIAGHPVIDTLGEKLSIVHKMEGTW